MDNPSEVAAWLLRRMFDLQEGWEHPTQLGLIEHLTVDQVRWRPSPDEKCIWEILLHVLFWRETVLARMTGEEEPDQQVPFPQLPDGSDPDELETQWRETILRAKEVNHRLVSAFAALDPSERHPAEALADKPRWIAALGVQAHDSFHLGQIGLLRRLQGLPPVEPFNPDLP